MKSNNRNQDNLIDMLQRAIKEHKVVSFDYESSSGKYIREVEPYLLAINDKGKGNVYFTGFVYPVKGVVRKNKNDNQGLYLLNKIDPNKFEVTNKTFDTLKIPAERIYGELPTVEVICKVEGLKKRMI